jgi:hypothetical protein
MRLIIYSLILLPFILFAQERINLDELCLLPTTQVNVKSVYSGTQAGIIRKFAKSDLSLITTNKLDTNLSIYGLAQDTDYLYVAGGWGSNNKNLVKVNKTDLSIVTYYNSSTRNNCIIIDSSYIYVGTSAGIAKFNLSDLSYVNANNVGEVVCIGLSDNHIYVGFAGTAPIKKYNKSDLQYVSATSDIRSSLPKSLLVYGNDFMVGADYLYHYNASTMAFIFKSSISYTAIDDMVANPTASNFIVAGTKALIYDKYYPTNPLYTYTAANNLLATAIDSTYNYVGGAGNTIIKLKKSDMTKDAESVGGGGEINAIVVDGD